MQLTFPFADLLVTPPVWAQPALILFEALVTPLPAARLNEFCHRFPGA